MRRRKTAELSHQDLKNDSSSAAVDRRSWMQLHFAGKYEFNLIVFVEGRLYLKCGGSIRAWKLEGLKFTNDLYKYVLLSPYFKIKTFAITQSIYTIYHWGVLGIFTLLPLWNCCNINGKKKLYVGPYLNILLVRVLIIGTVWD